MKKNSICKIVFFVAALTLLLAMASYAAADTCTAETGHLGPFSFRNYTNPTCTEPGHRDKYCDACGKFLGTEPIGAIGHQYETSERVITAPTCLNAGLKQVSSICMVCKYNGGTKDETWSFASAMGSDVQRSLNKFADKVEAGQKTVNKLTTGEYFDKKAKDKDSKKKANNTSKKITDRLNNEKIKNKDGDEASENLNVSTNVLRSQGVKADAGEDANKAAKQAGTEVEVTTDEVSE